MSRTRSMWRAPALVSVTLAALTLAPVPVAQPSISTQAGFHVVRFDGRITDLSRSRIEAAGLRVVDYEPENAYLVWGSTEQALSASALPGVSSVAPLGGARKLHPSLAGPVSPAPFTEVTVYGPALAPVRQFLSGLGEVVRTRPARSDGLLASVVLRLPAVAVASVIEHPAVLYLSSASLAVFVEDEATDQILAGNIGSNNRPVTGYAAWLTQYNLSGDGVKVAVVDTGIEELHPDLILRVDKEKDYFSPAEPIDTLGHGTHVSGIIGGAPPAGILPRDPDGFVYGQGVAPKVRLLDMNAVGLESILGEFPPAGGLQVLSRDAWRAGTRLWNASWHTGEGSRVGYTASTRMTDEMSRNADFEAPGSEEFLMVFSAGNAGTSGPTVPKEAKNIIAVGSTSSGRGVVWPLTANIDAVSSFSSRGPTKDGRVFPTVSAPGENVMSARAPEGGLTATCVPPPDGAGLYAACSGTSMAAPHVTGASALIHEWWKRRFGDLPSPAMVKALLVNTATDMGTKNIPNNNEGWGRVNLGNLFGTLPRIEVDQETIFGGPGEASSYTLSVGESGKPLRATLTWSDAPAAVGASSVLVNDLDLVVDLLDDAGQVVRSWSGNVFQGGLSVQGGTADRKNNVENVFLGTADAGVYRITVRAANLPGDGIPENADTTDQDFALVVTAASG